MPGGWPPAPRRRARGVARHELWLVALAAPLLLFPGRWTAAGAALIALGWAGRLVTTGRPSVRTPFDAPAALLALSAAVAVAVSALPAASAGRAWGILLGLALCYALANAGPAAGRWLPGALTVAGVAVAVAGVLGTDWSLAPALTRGWPEHLYGALSGLGTRWGGGLVAEALELGNPRDVGGVLALLLPLAVIRLCAGLWGRGRVGEQTGWPGRGRGRAGAIGAALAVVVMGAVLLLSQSLSAAGGVLAALWLAALVADRARRLWWAAGGVLLLALATVAVWPRLAALGALRDATSLSGQPDPGVAHATFGVAARLELWPRALEMVRDAPYSGSGLALFPQVMDRFYSGYLLGPERHAHNFPLHTAVDLGLPGLVAVVWLLAAFALHLGEGLRRETDPGRRATMVGLGAGVVAFLVFGLIDAIPLGARPSLLLWVLLGTALVLAPAGRGARRPGQRPLAAAMIALLALALLVPISWSGPQSNAGRVLAYRTLLSPAGGDPAVLAPAASALRRAAHGAPGRSGTWYLLGSVEARRGDPGAALEALRRGVLADAEAPLRRYATAEGLLRPALPRDWPALQRVYGQWTIRYPRRGEWYVASAIAACEGEGHRQEALARLAAGQDAGAAPDSLLAAYQERLLRGEGC